jgi:hypothetical protein
MYFPVPPVQKLIGTYWQVLKEELDNYPFSVGYDLEARKFKGFSMIIEQYNLSVHGGEETKGKR